MNNNSKLKTKFNFTSVIFDFDYTLADSSTGQVECVNYALRKLNLPPASDADINATMGISLPETFRILTQGSCQNKADEFVRFFVKRADEVMLDNIVLFASVKPAIEKLLDGGLTLGIVSTKYRYRIEAFLQRENLNHAFTVIIGGEDVTAHKPDPTGLRMAIAGLRPVSSHPLYVGDSTVDAETANRAGVPFVAVLSGVTAKDAFRDYKPFAVIENLTQLADLILK
jgi:phosphoglycolate phosphatase